MCLCWLVCVLWRFNQLSSSHWHGSQDTQVRRRSKVPEKANKQHTALSLATLKLNICNMEDDKRDTVKKSSTKGRRCFYNKGWGAVYLWVKSAQGKSVLCVVCQSRFSVAEVNREFSRHVVRRVTTPDVTILKGPAVFSNTTRLSWRLVIVLVLAQTGKIIWKMYLLSNVMTN